MIVVNSLLNIVLPAFFVIAVGVFVGKKFNPEIAPINRIALFSTTPALVFNSMLKTNLAFNSVAKLIFVYLLLIAIMIALSYLLSFKFSLPDRRGLMSTSAFSNTGNLNLPIALFAFGASGLELAVVLYIITTVLLFTLAPLIMTGGSASFDIKKILSLPVLWAAIIALIINASNISLVTGISRGIEILGQGAIPLVLLLLGMQIAQRGLKMPSVVNFFGAFSKLILAPVVAFLLAKIFGLANLELSVLVLLASMPPAVLNFMLALEFDASPEEVAGTIVLSTLSALFTISIVVSLLI